MECFFQQFFSLFAKHIICTASTTTNEIAFKLGYVLNRAHELIDFVDYEDLFNKYDTLNKISFDYAVVEHEPEIEVMRFAGTWKDLGTWNTLTEAMDSHAVGEALFNEKCENVHVVNELDVPMGKDGQKRELHIDKALDVANLKSSAEPRQPLRVLKYRQGVASELLTRCKYFEVYRMIVNTERRQKVHYRADGIAFRVLLCVNGCGTISYDGGSITFYKGDCIFVPADSEMLTLHGQAQFLDVRG